MPLTDLLHDDLVAIAPPWATFDETITGLINRLASAGSLNRETSVDARQALLAREAESSTAIAEIGVGVPHARLSAVITPVAALAVSRAGLYDAAPGVPIRIVALVLSPQAATDAHLQLLASVAVSLRSPSLRTALMRADAPAEVLAALRMPL